MVAGDPAKFEEAGTTLSLRRAQFTLSAMKLSQLPSDSVAEVALAGRSNAGKSSVLNVLTGQGSLARTSKTPGRTQALNCFRVGAGRYLVDLPGYGFAKVSQEQRRHWGRELGGYFLERRQLCGLVLVLDVRRGLTDLDWQLIDLVAHSGAALHCLLNKSDKLSNNAANATLARIRRDLDEAGVIASSELFSALKRTGVDECARSVERWLKEAAPAGGPGLDAG